MPRMLTADDLDGIGSDAVRGSNPRPHQAELVAAVDQGRIADPADVPYALALAADIAEQLGQQDEALALSTRAVSSAEGADDHDDERTRHAELLLHLGRDDEGMAELRALRPSLTRDRVAGNAVVDALVGHGRSELAEEWLTAALRTASEIADRAVGTENAEDADDILESLLLRRRQVRRNLGLAPDESDGAADEILAALAGSIDLVFWPQAAHEALLAARPEEADELGSTWDEHRAMLERALQEADADGDALLVEVATPELVTASATGEDLSAVPDGPLLAWPPGRNDPCWCGSRVKYKKCCLPRARD